MLFCLGLFAILVYETVFASVCSQTFTEAPGHIEAISRRYKRLGHTRCQYLIRAPAHTTIMLNFTHLYDEGARVLCLPEVRIIEVWSHHKESQMGVLCPAHHNFQGPQVFQSRASLLRVTYEWPPNMESGFSLYFKFQKISKGKSVSGLHIVIIVIAIVLMLGLIMCIVSHYKMGAWSWHERWGRPPNPSEPQSLLQVTPLQHLSQSQHTHTHAPHSPVHTHAPHSPVLYTPDNIEQRQQLELVSLQNQHVRQKSVQMDFNLGLPPIITLPDGEEFQYNSSKSIHIQGPSQDNEIIRTWIKPPPNRIVPEDENPLSYRSNSVSLLSKPSTPPVLRTSDTNFLVKHSNNASVAVNDDIHRNFYTYVEGGSNSFPTTQPRSPNTRNTTSKSLDSRSNSGRRMKSFFDLMSPLPRYCNLTTNQDQSSGSSGGV
ncbi:uncharacterized protein LOC106460687 isoform X2 [Limulus polyphemus]|uniref:Uncharacterized protein LOC106460687 isoform X2 n=1 Tax=Limulus polyphemus TaxID=6850 RepID=A0ABM1SHS1_LIMPO|nr:uncharacterized protein LOC106460687 isoform X2 [Limulus polyphemus]